VRRFHTQPPAGVATVGGATRLVLRNPRVPWKRAAIPQYPRLAGLALILGILWTWASLPSGATTYFDREYLIDTWETDQGLPENSATAMVQTPEGYLWFGTFNGLVRFDGVRFAVFDPSNTPEMPSPGIVNLHLDASRRLWVSTVRGLLVSEPDRWTTFHAVPEWRGDFVRTFSEQAGVLCATSFNGKVLRVQGDVREALPDPPGVPGAGFLGYVDPSGRIHVEQRVGSTYYGFWDGRAWQASALGGELHPDFLSMTGLSDGRLLVLKRSELLTIEDERVVQRRPVRLDPPVKEAWSISPDSEGNVWVSSRGLHRISPGGEVRYFCATNGITYDGLRLAFEDRERNLWVGGSGGGLMRMKRRFFSTLGDEVGLTERNVKAVLEESPGRVLIGTYRAGLFEWQGGRVTPLETQQTPDLYWVQCLMRDRGRNLWLGSYAGAPGLSSLMVLGPEGRREIPSEHTGGRSVNALFEDSQGQVWVGGGSTVTTCRDGRFTVHSPGPGVNLDGVRAFAEDPSRGILWAGGGEGLAAFSSNRWRTIEGPRGGRIGDVTCLHFEKDGALWVGGIGAGLVRLKDGAWSVIGPRQGLPAVRVMSVLDDGAGHWWLGSNRGILRVDERHLLAVADGAQRTLTCQMFNVSDGLASVECNSSTPSGAVRDSEGRLWFATIKGAAVIDPRKLRLNTNVPPVLLESVMYRDAQGLPARAEVGSPARPRDRAVRVTIPAGSSQLEARFSVLSFTAPEKVQLRYEFLRNGEVFGSSEGAERTFHSPWLPPGQYELRVTAANNDGFWNEQGATLALFVRPTLWQTTWFRAVGLLAVAALAAVAVGGWNRSRFRRTMERLRQQQALAEERARSAALTQHSSDVITLLDGRGRVIYESPSTERILGYPPGHLLGKDPIDLVHPEDRQGMTEALRTVYGRTYPGIPTTFRLLHARGHWLHVESLASNLLDLPGVEGVLVTTRDVTDRRRVEEERHRLETQLIQAQKMEAVGQLAGGVAHDFNNILTVVLVELGLLRGEPGLSPVVSDSLAEIESEARRASSLVRQLLVFSRRQVLQTQDVELNALLGELCKMLRRLIGEQADLVLRFAAKELWLRADPGMLEQVVMNLVVNARDAIGQGGQIALSTENVDLPDDASSRNAEAQPGRHVCIVVTDNGCGMDEATCARIFEPFFTTKGVGKGTGLGLATVYGIVHQHRGWVEVESQPGRGTTFRVFLPAREPAVTAAHPESRPAGLVGGKETILLVEDEDNVRRAASLTLRRLGYQVLEAANGREAMAAWLTVRDSVDLLLTDMVMPGGLNGQELACRLREDKPSLRCLLMSGYSRDLLPEGHGTGDAVEFLAKPFESVQLAAKIRAVLDAP